MRYKDKIARAMIGQVNSQMATITSQTNSTIVNADIGLRRWRAAMAKVRSGQNAIINLNFAGDSITEGAVTNIANVVDLNNSFFAKVRTALQTKYGDVGKGMIPVTYPNNGTPLWTQTGTWGISGSRTYGFCGYDMETSTNGDAVTFAFNGTGINVLLVTASALGKFNYKIDGGSNTLYDCYSASNVWNKILPITGLANGAHTLTITKNSDAKAIFILGAYEIKGTNGIRCNMSARYGSKIGQHVTSSNILLAEVDTMSPNLTIISFVTNDCGAQTPLASFQTDLQTYITRALTFGDVLLTNIGVNAQTPAIPMTSYNAIIKNLAIANNCAFLDVYARWSGGNDAINNGFLSATITDPHPTYFGHQDIATAILKVIDEY